METEVTINVWCFRTRWSCLSMSWKTEVTIKVCDVSGQGGLVKVCHGNGSDYQCGGLSGQGGLADVCVTENISDYKCVVFQDKVVLPTTQGVGKGSDKDTMPFSLWRWLHSIINLLVETLKDPWLDGYVPNYTNVVHCGSDGVCHRP